MQNLGNGRKLIISLIVSQIFINKLHNVLISMTEQTYLVS